jgi:hypothetical protein
MLYGMKNHSFFMILVIGVLALMSCATAQGVYLNDDGTTFTRNFSGIFSANVPYSIYSDTFTQSEVIRQYRQNLAKTYQESSSIDGGRTLEGGISTGMSNDREGRMYQIVETYEVTVTRHWYTRTTYYQNQKPTYSMVYDDKENRRLVNTERRYLN